MKTLHASYSSKYLNCIVFYIVPAGAEGETAASLKSRAVEADKEKNALSKLTRFFSATCTQTVQSIMWFQLAPKARLPAPSKREQPMPRRTP
jgi:hypothetical protein